MIHLGRLVRLIPSKPVTLPLKTLLSHRLPSDPLIATTEWHTILYGSSHLILSLSPPQRELVRSFLNSLNLEIVKRSRPPHSTFNFSNASIGNLFLTGVRLFAGSFESAIYLFSTLGGLDESKTRVVPAINSNFSHHISAELENGDIIVGQNAISHPSEVVAGDPLSSESFLRARELNRHAHHHDDEPEDASLPCSLPTLRRQNIIFHKSDTTPLSSRIKRIWYINPYGQPILPSPNPKVLSVLEEASCVVFCIGSLYTSILPNIILKGVGEKLASRWIRTKILILNGCLDRETAGYEAVDFVRAVVEAAESSFSKTAWAMEGHYDAVRERHKDVDGRVWSRYVTHLIYLGGEGTPIVDKEALASRGIECVRIYGRRNVEGNGMHYDGAALGQALEAIIGRSQAKSERARRNTLER